MKKKYALLLLLCCFAGYMGIIVFDTVFSAFGATISSFAGDFTVLLRFVIPLLLGIVFLNRPKI